MATPPTDGHSPTDTTTPEHGTPQAESNDTAFVCPYCGECTMEQFFSEGCPKHVSAEPEGDENTKILFPYLDTKGLDNDDRLDLEDRLQCETRKMKLCFAKFTLNVIRSLETLQIPLEKIKISVLSLDAFTDGIGVKVLDEEDTQKIEAAKNVSEIFIAFHKYISFFNYHIIEHIIDEHGAAEDHKSLADYVDKFRLFCQRSIFQVPQDVFPPSSRKTAKVFALKYTEGVATLGGVEGIKRKIARVFSLRPAALQLCSIKKGCVELHFLISAAVADRIFPMSPSQHSALSEIGVRVLSSEGVDQTSREEDKPQDYDVPLDQTQDGVQSHEPNDRIATLPQTRTPMAEFQLKNKAKVSQFSTAEYLTLCKSFVVLMNHVKARPITFNDALFEKGLVPLTTYKYVRIDAVPNERKAQKLIDAVIDKVEMDPSVYHDFMSILKSEGPSAGAVVDQLEENFKAERVANLDNNSALDGAPKLILEELRGSVSSSALQTSGGESTPEYVALHKSYEKMVSHIAPRIGDISAHKEDLKELGITELSYRHYDYLSSTQETEDDSKKNSNKHGAAQIRSSGQAAASTGSISNVEPNLTLEFKEAHELEQESQDMEYRFSVLMASILSSLENRQISKEQLVAHLMGFKSLKKVYDGSNQCLFRRQKSKLDSATSLAEVWMIIDDYISFFDYEILSQIVASLGSEEDQQNVARYDENFKDYIKRRVVPMTISSSRDDSTQFVVKLDATYDGCEIGRLKRLERKLSNFLNLNPGILKLSPIRLG